MLAPLGRRWPHVFINSFFSSVGRLGLWLLLAGTGLELSQLVELTVHEFEACAPI